MIHVKTNGIKFKKTICNSWLYDEHQSNDVINLDVYYKHNKKPVSDVMDEYNIKLNAIENKIKILFICLGNILNGDILSITICQSYNLTFDYSVGSQGMLNLTYYFLETGSKSWIFQLAMLFFILLY